MSTRVEFRWPDDLVAAVDKARGSEPRSAFVRRHIEQRVKVAEIPKTATATVLDQMAAEERLAEIRNDRPSFDPSDAL